MTEIIDFKAHDCARNLPALSLSDEPYDLMDADRVPLRSHWRLLQEAREELAEAHRKIAVLEHQARTDPVTGLLNRRGFEDALETTLARVRRFGEIGTLVMVDLDGFKGINDTYGHQVGDLVLSAVGTTLKRHTRDTDSVARIGGDEFAILLSAADMAGAQKRVAILDRMVNWLTVPWKGQQIPVRASFGAVPYGPRHTADSLFEAADTAMYARKQGR